MSKPPAERDLPPLAVRRGIALCAGLLLVICPLLGGTADRPYTLVMAATAALLAAATGAATQRPLAVSYASVGLGLAVILCLLQMVPLPPGLRALLAPGSDGDLRLILRGLPSWPQPQTAWLPLSVDARATANEALSLAAALGLLTTLGTSHGTGEGSPLATSKLPYPLRWLVLAPTLICLLGALTALGLPLPAPVAVPGPGATRALLAAGLHNSNHMAALAGLGAVLALGLALSLPSNLATGWRSLPLLCCALCNVALLGTLSRAGLFAWLLAQGLLLAWALHRAPRAGRANRAATLRLGLVGLLCTVLLAALLADQAPALLRERLTGSALTGIAAPGSKLHIWREALALVRGHLLFGVGHGAGENLLQHVHAVSGRMRFVYLENQWLQLILDFGLLGGGLLFACLALALRDALRDTDTLHPPTLRGAVFLSFSALALHNVFDFNLAIAGVLWPTLGAVSLVEVRRFRVPAAAVTGLAALTLLSVLLVARWAPSHDEDGAALRRLASDRSTSTATVVAAGEAAIARHPFDSYLPALVAARLLQSAQTDEAPAWLNRALLANPRDPLALRETARLQWLTGRPLDALLFISLAITHGDDDDRRRSIDLLAQNARDGTEARLGLPSPATLADLLDRAGTAADPRWPFIADLARSALPPAQEPSATVERAAYWLGRAALAQRDEAAALAALPHLLALPPSAGPAFPTLLVADLLDLLTDTGHAADAMRLGRMALARAHATEWLLATARAGLRRTPPDAVGIRPLLEEALTSPQALSPTSRPLLARTHELYADLETAAGNPTAALSHRQAATRLRQP